MQLRDTRLLLVILGVPCTSSNLHKLAAQQGVDLFQRASSSEGVLCIRKYWDSHCSTFSKLPAVALLATGSCPKGLAPSLFLELLRRLTDLQEWQIWALWDTLDVHSCGFVGCAEFTLLVVLLCAGAAQRQLQAVHAYAASICRTFLGAHVGSSYAGLCQCCQLLGLPVSGVHTALLHRQQHALLQRPPGSSRNEPVAAAAPVSSSNCSSSSGRHSSTAGSSSRQTLPLQEAVANAAGPAEPAAATVATTTLGCCCRSGSSCGGGQWACGAAEHRRNCGSNSSRTAQQGQQGSSPRLALDCQPLTLLSVQDVELLLFQVAAAHEGRFHQSLHSQLQLEDGRSSHRECRIC